MTKNILALCGMATLFSALGIWQFGSFSSIRERIERQTAVARGQHMVRELEQQAASLTDRARKLRIDARTREKVIEREEQQTNKTRQAVVALIEAARHAGLPKPSAAGPEDLRRTLMFAGRTLSASEAYSTLERWQSNVRESEQRLQVTRDMVNKVRSTADLLEQKQASYLTQVQNTRATLERLELHRDTAALEMELAELGAIASGNPAGELKDVLDTLQKQIDEYEATSEVLSHERASPDGITPDEALAGRAAEVTIRNELDALWGD